MSKILYLTADDIGDPFTLNLIQMREDLYLYWTDDWSPEFYSTLAYEGFISTATSIEHERPGILVPELQRSYAVLDWHHLHISRKVQALYGKNPGKYHLTITSQLKPVIKAIQAYHDPCWLIDLYGDLLIRLSSPKNGFPCKAMAVELRDSQGNLLAGELGYTIGATYTSLTGFAMREEGFNNLGNLQMVLLAQQLEKQGYHFWNLGHPYMDYKKRLGAQVLKRSEFLKRWYKSRDICIKVNPM